MISRTLSVFIVENVSVEMCEEGQQNCLNERIGGYIPVCSVESACLQCMPSFMGNCVSFTDSSSTNLVLSIKHREFLC